MEEWRPIDGHPGYEVSSLGRVRSYRRRHNGLAGEPRLLKQSLTDKGYLRVGLRRADGTGSRTIYVHKLVLTAFVGPAPEGMECRHLDGISQNNRLDNLAWGTDAENGADRVRHAKPRKVCLLGHRLTPDDILAGTCPQCEELRRRLPELLASVRSNQDPRSHG